MKKIIWAALFILTGFISVYSQNPSSGEKKFADYGNETFINFPETSQTYNNGTFKGCDGSTWTYIMCSGNSAGNIDGHNPVLKKDASAKVESGILLGGCEGLTFKFMQVFSSNVDLSVYVNEKLVKVLTTKEEQGKIKFSDTINVSVPGSFTLRFQQSNSSSGQVSIGDIRWTSKSSCSTITYEGKTYNTIIIGNQNWLKENLDVGSMISGNTYQTNNNIIEKNCLYDDTANCTKYGGFYQWAEAVQYKNGASDLVSPDPPFTGFIQGICPQGWHIPSQTEFQTLNNVVNGNSNLLKAVGQGSGEGSGTNTSGFSALLAGQRYPDGSFLPNGVSAKFWFSTERNNTNALWLNLNSNNSNISIYDYLKTAGYSVRCLKDEFGGALVLQSPNGGERWAPGSIHNIYWSGNKIVNIKLEYTTDNGALWNSIANSVPASAGSFLWTVPNAQSQQCKVKISDAADYSLHDISDSTFSIPVIPSISIDSKTAAVGDSLALSINIQNFQYIGALTLKIQYDTAKLSFGSILEFNPQISNALYGVNNGIITIAWDGVTGITAVNEKLAELKFFFIGATEPFQVYFVVPQCEVAGIDGIPISVLYFNGMVTPGVSISGMVYYPNFLTSVNTSLSDVKVFLKSTISSLDSTVTNTSGRYNFNEKINDSYILSANSSKILGGVNSTDALWLRQYITGSKTFDSLQLKAADVNRSGTVNSTDALLIRQRTVGSINSFVAGDWVFENHTIVVNGVNVLKNIRGLCTGDVNGSYFPPALAKPKPSLSLLSGGKLITCNESIEVPVSFNKAISFNALTLLLSYKSSNGLITGVKSKIDGLAYSVTNNSVKIAWDNLNPVTLTEGEEFLRLILKVTDKNLKNPDLQLNLEPGSEIADCNGNVIENASINIPVLNLLTENGYQLSQNYPNPFNPVTTIKYSLPIDSHVKLVVSNSLGQIVKVLSDEVKPAGTFEARFDAGNLSSGIYFCTMTAKSLNGSREFKTVNKLILMK